jgi:hypothetical protein
MPMYYFNLIDKHGRSLQDEHGEDLPDDAAAIRYAGEVARDLSGPNGSMDFQQGAIDILDSERRCLLGKAVAEFSTDSTARQAAPADGERRRFAAASSRKGTGRCH